MCFADTKRREVSAPDAGPRHAELDAEEPIPNLEHKQLSPVLLHHLKIVFVSAFLQEDLMAFRDAHQPHCHVYRMHTALASVGKQSSV